MTYRPGQMKLTPTVRSLLTVFATLAAAIVATVPSEAVRVAAAVVLTTCTALGIVPPHVEHE